MSDLAHMNYQALLQRIAELEVERDAAMSALSGALDRIEHDGSITHIAGAWSHGCPRCALGESMAQSLGYVEGGGAK